MKYEAVDLSRLGMAELRLYQRARIEALSQLHEGLSREYPNMDRRDPERAHVKWAMELLEIAVARIKDDPNAPKVQVEKKEDTRPWV